MKVNSNTLYLISGISLVISGFLFALIQIIHPSNDISSIGSITWMVAHIITFVFPIFGILGITGIYLKQFEKSGFIGLLGYFLIIIAFILMICFAFYEAFIAPELIDEAPAYVSSVLSILDGKTGPKYITEIYAINGITYLLGGVLFGIATSRSKVFPVWSGLAIVFSVLVALAAAIFPALARPSAILFGFSIINLGIILLKNNKNIIQVQNK